MNLSKNEDRQPTLLVKLSITLVLFCGAFLLDNASRDLNVYPLYLASILYASINISFYFTVPISALAAYLSFFQENLSLASSVNILIRTILLVIISFLFSSYFGLAKTYRRRFELLKGLVPQCPDCGAILCNDGKWRPLEEISDKPELLGSLPKHECNTKSDSPFIKVY